MEKRKDAAPWPAPEATAAGEAVSIGLRINFGAGALGMAIVLNTLAGILAPFMTNFLGIGAATVAVLLLASKLYDMVTDPLMGVLSDRTRTRWGRRRPFLFLGGIVTAAGFFLIFNPPQLDHSPALLNAWVLGALLLTYTGYTLFNIPYLALPAEMTTHYHERTALMSWRTVFINVGALLAFFSFAIVEWLGNDRQAHGAMGLIFAALIAGGSIYCFFGLASARQTTAAPRAKTPSIGRQVRTIAANRPLMSLLGAKLCQLLGLAASGAAGVYFKVVILKMSYTQTTSFLVVNVLVILAAIPLWNLVSRRHGKRLTYMIATACFALTVSTWLLATAADPLSYIFARAVFLGFFASGVIILGAALLPDAVEYDFLTTGMRREATMSAFYATVEKLAFAAGPALALLMLSAFGYQSGTEGMQIEQPESAITAIYVTAGLAPALLYGLSLVFLMKYDLSEEKLGAARAASGAAGH